ncbi:MAG: response regulator [Armatimonadetes bacterium]|jgi:two-component system chemotaxis response regulator CheY|nr:response regulator [Armatimonadota bacterium]
MKLNTLVVDDSRVMRSMIMQALTKSGLAEFQFSEAEDGMDALETISFQSIDIAFVDWNMPKMTGVEFVAKLRAKEKGYHIPVIMVTSENAIGKFQDALDRAGADAYVTKPFTHDDLVRQVQPLLERISAKRAPQVGAKTGGFFSKLMGSKSS